MWLITLTYITNFYLLECKIPEVAQLVEALCYKSEGRGFDFRWCHSNFSLTYYFLPHYDPGVDSASNRNECQEYILGVKATGAWGWKPYHLHVPIVLKSGSLNLLEHSEPVQACNRIAFTLLSLLTYISTNAPYLSLVYHWYHIRLEIESVVK